MVDLDRESKIGDYDLELQNALFSLVITYCEHKKQVLPHEQALHAVADYLDHLSEGLRTITKDT